jgi:acetyl esterase
MPLDPQLAPLVAAMADFDASSPLADRTVEEQRAGLVAFGALLGEPEAVGRVDDLEIDGPAGPVPVRIYTPPGDGPWGALVWFHGGGFVIGDLETHDHVCRELTNRAGCAVVSVDYRLAPEHPYPAAVDDCWRALGWVVESGAAHGIDPGRIAVGGDSAGGNLAAVIARRARDAGGPELRLQLLVYPVTDLRPAADWASRRENAVGYVLTSEHMDFFHDCYVGADGGAEPDASPILADDLSGLPPAHVVLAGFDPLHDEGLAYAERLQAAGVPVTIDDEAGAVHIFFQLGPIAQVGRRAVDAAAAAVGEALGS